MQALLDHKPGTRFEPIDACSHRNVGYMQGISDIV
jgi:hypothetical protein